MLPVYLFLSVFFWLTPSNAAVSEDKILQAAQSIVVAWQQHLSKGLKLLQKDEYGEDWIVWRYALAGNIQYDVKRTDSLLHPYVLVIRFRAFVGDNSLATPGNSSPEAALRRTSDADFTARSKPWVFLVNYGYKDNVWSITNGNEYFNYLMSGRNLQPNQQFFSKVIRVRTHNQ